MTVSQGSILITGANGGLGSAIVSHILKTPKLATNYTGIYAVRKAATATQLQSILGHAPRAHRHAIVDIDLSSLDSVRKTAASINSRVEKGELPKIRALILNAGYQEHTTMTMSGDGFDMTWQVNYLANFLLSLMLLQSMDKSGRILIIGSWTHDSDDERNEKQLYGDSKWRDPVPSPDALARGKWSTPQDDPGSRLSGLRRYGASKLCVTMLLHELAARVANDSQLDTISIIGLDPGGMPTDITRQGSFLFNTILMKVVLPVMAPITVKLKPNGILRPPSKSAADVVRACFEIDAQRGKLLYLNGTEEATTATYANKVANRKELWEYGVKAAGLTERDTVLADWT